MYLSPSQATAVTQALNLIHLKRQRGTDRHPINRNESSKEKRGRVGQVRHVAAFHLRILLLPICFHFNKQVRAKRQTLQDPTKGVLLS